MKNIKIALLSTQKSEILGHIINKFIEYDIKIDSIILDSKLPGDKHFKIWDERTNSPNSWCCRGSYGVAKSYEMYFRAFFFRVIVFSRSKRL